MKKALSLICSIFIFMGCVLINVNTAEASTEIIPKENLSLQLDSGETLTFENVEDYNLYVNHHINNQNIQSREVIITTRVISEGYKNYEFIGTSNLTPTWQKTSKYTVSRASNYNASGSYSYNGLTGNISVGYSTGVSFDIAANSSLYSKLGLWADLKVQHKRDYYFDTYLGTITEVDYTSAKPIETYLDVKYK